MIDIADFAVGLSRQLYGLTMHSERPGHRMYEQWHPLGVVGVISAFNFPVAVWAWNAMIAAVCGDCVLWQPSSETPLTAIAVQKICNRVLDRHGLKGVFNLVIGPSDRSAETLVRRPRASRWSASPGRPKWAGTSPKRWRGGWAARILELGGNNGIIVMDDAESRSGAARRPVRRRRHRRPALHHDAPPVPATRHRAAASPKRWSRAYRQVKIGDPLDEDTLMGPLVNRRAVDDMMDGLRRIREQGGEMLYGGRALDRLLRRSPRWCARGPTCRSSRRRSSRPSST